MMMETETVYKMMDTISIMPQLTAQEDLYVYILYAATSEQTSQNLIHI
jgi:hypothetical protein